MSFTFNGVEPGTITFNGTEVDTVIFNGVEVWTGKYYIVKNSVIIDTSILDTASKGNITSGTFGVFGESGANAVTMRGTVVTNTLANLAIRSINDEGTYRASVLVRLSYFGFAPPTGYTKLVIKGTYSNVNNGNSDMWRYYSGFSYADVESARWTTLKDNGHQIYDGAFEESINISSMSQVFVEWLLYGSSTVEFDMSLKITDMYFE